MPTIVVCMSGWLSVNRSMNSLRRRAVEEVVEVGLPPSGRAASAPSAASSPPTAREIGDRGHLVGLTPRDAAADDGAGARVAASVMTRFVLALERRVRDLERVEHAHRDVVGDVGQRARHPEEPHLAFVAQRGERLDRAVLLELLARRAHVELHDVDVVDLHAPQALLDAGADVLGREDVRRSLALGAVPAGRSGTRTCWRGRTRRGGSRSPRRSAPRSRRSRARCR